MTEQLIERLEAATGPDRELDARICIALGLSKDNVMVGVDGWCINSETNPNPYKSPAYTASIDAALTLVPEGWTGFVAVDADNETWLWPCDGTMSRGFRIAHKIPAIGLCIAALKARP